MARTFVVAVVGPGSDAVRAAFPHGMLLSGLVRGIVLDAHLLLSAEIYGADGVASLYTATVPQGHIGALAVRSQVAATVPVMLCRVVDAHNAAGSDILREKIPATVGHYNVDVDTQANFVAAFRWIGRRLLGEPTFSCKLSPAAAPAPASSAVSPAPASPAVFPAPASPPVSPAASPAVSPTVSPAPASPAASPVSSADEAESEGEGDPPRAVAGTGGGFVLGSDSDSD